MLAERDHFNPATDPGKLGRVGRVIAAVLDQALKNDGVIARTEALAIGMSPRTLDRHIADKVLVRVAPGMYALPGALSSPRATLMAATKALGGVVSHETAARIHGVHAAGPELVVTVPHRKTHRFPGLVVHQSTDIREGDTRMLKGLPVTTPPRTVMDLAAVLRPQQLGRSLDEMVRLRATTNEEVANLLEELARKGKPGVTRLRSILAPRLGGRGVVESVLESRMMELIELAGLPTPDIQFRPGWLRDINGRADFAYPDHRIVVEADSRAWHGDEATFQADRQRDNIAQLAGWRVLRFTWTDITKRPDYVVDSIRRALGLSLPR